MANGACLGDVYQWPTANLAVFPMQNLKRNFDKKYYAYGAWSGSPPAADFGLARGVDFASGDGTWLNIFTTGPVRLVRGQ